MGKTKTAVISGLPEEGLSGEEKYKQKQRKKEKETEKKDKVRVPGLGGGQRVKAIKIDIPETDEEVKPEKKSVIQPKVRGKKYQEVKLKVDKNKKYPIADAIKLMRDTSYSKFDGSAEIHLVVGKVGLSTNIQLPFSTGKLKKIEIANEKTIENLKKGKINFDVLLSTKEMMPKLVPFAKLLGPKGLMPNPKTGTIIKSAKEKTNFTGNKITLKTERKVPLIHAVFGKVSQKDKELISNLEAILKGIGPKQRKKAYIKATMGPSIKLEV